MPVAGPRILDIWLLRTLRGELVRELALQATQALDFLHSQSVGHGDIKSPNILFQLTQLDSWTDGEIYERLGEPEKSPMWKLSGEPLDACAPAYLVWPLDMDSIDERYLLDSILIVDFGQAFHLNTPPEDLGTPMGYCPPELILDYQASAASDVWALACALYGIRMGRDLFPMFDGSADEALTQMVQLLGKLPEPWWSAWEGKGSVFNDNGVIRKGQPIINEWTLGDLMRMPLPRPIEVRRRDGAIDTTAPESEVVPMSAAEVERFSDLLDRMLRYDPAERILRVGGAAAPVVPYHLRRWRPLVVKGVRGDPAGGRGATCVPKTGSEDGGAASDRELASDCECLRLWKVGGELPLLRSSNRCQHPRPGNPSRMQDLQGGEVISRSDIPSQTSRAP
ncbi:hypothetical protein MMC18_004830 [Xylographa bjoerkii]|nr:hypothetical protein [Xylographa bjoerkii]